MSLFSVILKLWKSMIENQSTLWTILPKAKRSSAFLLKLQLIDPIFVFHLITPKESCKCLWCYLEVGHVFCTRSRKELPLYANVISGMVQGNIAFNHFHFLTLGDKFYLGLFAWSSQHNFASCHWWSIMTIPNSFCDCFGQ